MLHQVDTFQLISLTVPITCLQDKCNILEKHLKVFSEGGSIGFLTMQDLDVSKAGSKRNIVAQFGHMIVS